MEYFIEKFLARVLFLELIKICVLLLLFVAFRSSLVCFDNSCTPANMELIFFAFGLWLYSIVIFFFCKILTSNHTGNSKGISNLCSKVDLGVFPSFRLMGLIWD